MVAASVQHDRADDEDAGERRATDRDAADRKRKGLGERGGREQRQQARERRGESPSAARLAAAAATATAAPTVTGSTIESIPGSCVAAFVLTWSTARLSSVQEPRPVVRPSGFLYSE